jgi:hypothetical protein
MRIVHHIKKKSDAWTKFEILFLTRSRRIKLFKTDTRISAHVDVEGTGKTLIFIAKRDGSFFHYMEDHWHPDASQGDPTCIYEWQN